MPRIRVCAVQSAVSSSFGKNISKAEKFFERASENGCDIICFPEIFLTGPLNKNSYNKEIPAISKKIVSGYCKNYALHCVMGSIIEKLNGSYFNISYLLDAGGEIIGNYKKNHLVLNSEGKYLEAGTKTPVFRTKIGRIGIQICRDLLYPEITRKLALNGAEIIFCPSFWAESSTAYNKLYNHAYFKNAKPREVDFLTSARAIETQVVFVYSNAAGNYNDMNSRNILLGRTQIALPFYGTAGRLDGNKEGFLAKEIDLGIIKDARKIYKIQEDLKDYYDKA